MRFCAAAVEESLGSLGENSYIRRMIEETVPNHRISENAVHLAILPALQVLFPSQPSAAAADTAYLFIFSLVNSIVNGYFV
ncbi:MAG TPA: hypothetical protein PK843_13930 [bacterium]|nr:hypothetical protein [bacterium]HPN35609.1 hypothetical protein [bacterium]